MRHSALLFAVAATTMMLGIGPVAAAASPGSVAIKEPSHDTAVTSVDDVTLRLTLDHWPLVAGKPTHITAKIRNRGKTQISYATDSCEAPFILRGQMLDARWRQNEPTDVEAIRAAGGNEALDFRWRVEEWTVAGQDDIYLGFTDSSAIGKDSDGCADVAIGHEVPPGGMVVRRFRWDGQASPSLGPPPEGLARITGSFDFHRAGTPGRQHVEVELDAPVIKGRDFDLLQPMEAVHAALADDHFRSLIEAVNLGHAAEEYVYFDGRHDTWVVGACTDGRKWIGNWRAAALVDPRSGEVDRVIERVTGRDCDRGPWKRR